MAAGERNPFVEGVMFIGGIFGIIHVIADMDIGSKSLAVTKEGVSVSGAQLAHQQEALLLFERGTAEVRFDGNMRCESKDAKITNRGQAVALNCKVHWWPNRGEVDEQLRKELPHFERETYPLKPYHLSPGETAELCTCNLPKHLHPKHALRNPTYSGSVILEWKGMDQQTHYVEQSYVVKWIMPSTPGTANPYCQIQFGDHVTSGKW